MRIIPPETVTPTELTATNVAITETEWTAGTYGTGMQRYVGTDLYEVVADPDTSDEPTAGVEKDPPTWIKIGKINRYKMFDFIIGEETSQSAGSIDVTVVFPNLTNAVALFNVTGASVQVVMTDGTTEVYNKTRTLVDNSGVSDWYSYFFEPIVRDTEAVFLDLPSYVGASVRIVVENDGSDTIIGEAIIGRQRILGVTLMDFSFGIEDFSRKERDQFGNFTIVERRFAKITEYEVHLTNSRVNPTFRALAEVRAKPTVYIGDESKSESIALGFYRDFSTNRVAPNDSEMSLEIEGLV